MAVPRRAGYGPSSTSSLPTHSPRPTQRPPELQTLLSKDPDVLRPRWSAPHAHIPPARFSTCTPPAKPLELGCFTLAVPLPLDRPCSWWSSAGARWVGRGLGTSRAARPSLQRRSGPRGSSKLERSWIGFAL